MAAAAEAPCEPPLCFPQRTDRAGRGAGHAPTQPSPPRYAPRGSPPRARPRVTTGWAPFVCGPSAAAAPLARPPRGPAPSWLASCICMSTGPSPPPSRAGVRGARRLWLPRRAGARALARASRACSLRAAAALQPCQRSRVWAHHEPWPCP